MTLGSSATKLGKSARDALTHSVAAYIRFRSFFIFLFFAFVCEKKNNFSLICFTFAKCIKNTQRINE